MMPEQTILLPGGREVKYSDVVHHHTEIHFDLWDRIKILFHGKTRVHSEIYTGETCNVKGSTATVYVSPIFKRRDRVVGLMEPAEKEGKDAVQP